MQIVPTLADALAMLSLDILNKDLIYSLLLVVSGILMDDNGVLIFHMLIKDRLF